MPELPEVRIMSEFINYNCQDRIFNRIFSVEKGNNYIDITDDLKLDKFKLKSTSRGKELSLYLDNLLISVFMGMSGNFSFIKTKDINFKYIRLRIDSIDGYSLLLYGGYLGPKWCVGKFKTGTKRGPDPTIEFEEFKKNILDNLDKKIFDKPICEVLLNQEYFSGIGNYIRSTILYYLNDNPFESARNIIVKHKDKFFDLCKDVPMKSYQLNGGQLKDWKNPLGDKDSTEFKDWVFYKKGESIKDSNGRTFWYDSKWKK